MRNYSDGSTGFPPLTGTDAPEVKTDLNTTNQTNQERVKRWYLEPLKKMKGDDVFICMAICLLLLEKYLRSAGHIEEGKDFTQGHRVFKYIGKIFSISEDFAFAFWQDWRNGLLHKAMPKSGNLRYMLNPSHQEVFVIKEKETLSFNPWKFRDKVLELVENEKNMWKDKEYYLFEEYASL